MALRHVYLILVTSDSTLRLVGWLGREPRVQAACNPVCHNLYVFMSKHFTRFPRDICLRQTNHSHACQTPFMSIYLHIQILYTCIDLCMCAYVYLLSFPTKHLKKPRHFPLLKPPFPTWSVWPDGSKGGEPKSLQTQFDTPSSEDMSDNKITNFNKKTFTLSDNLIGWCLVEKLGPMPWS